MNLRKKYFREPRFFKINVLEKDYQEAKLLAQDKKVGLIGSEADEKSYKSEIRLIYGKLYNVLNYYRYPSWVPKNFDMKENIFNYEELKRLKSIMVSSGLKTGKDFYYYDDGNNMNDLIIRYGLFSFVRLKASNIPQNYFSDQINIPELKNISSLDLNKFQILLESIINHIYFFPLNPEKNLIDGKYEKEYEGDDEVFKINSNDKKSKYFDILLFGDKTSFQEERE